MNLFIQIVGLFALLSWVSSVQLRKKSDILKLQILASIFYCTHYALLGATSAAWVSVVSILRLLTIFLVERKGKIVSVPVLLFFFGLLLVVGSFTYDGWRSLIPIVITILYTYGTWQSNTQLLRLIFFCAGWVWIYFNWNVGSYILIVGNVMEVASSAVSFMRYRRRSKATSPGAEPMPDESSPSEL